MIIICDFFREIVKIQTEQYFYHIIIQTRVNFMILLCFSKCWIHDKQYLPSGLMTMTVYIFSFNWMFLCYVLFTILLSRSPSETKLIWPQIHLDMLRVARRNKILGRSLECQFHSASSGPNILFGWLNLTISYATVLAGLQTLNAAAEWYGRGFFSPDSRQKWHFFPFRSRRVLLALHSL